MFYATVDNGEKYTFRFYTKALRDQFLGEIEGARALTAKQAKFVPGGQRYVTYVDRTSKGWIR